MVGVAETNGTEMMTVEEEVELPDPESAVTAATLEFARQSSRLRPVDDSLGLESQHSDVTSSEKGRSVTDHTHRASSSPTPQHQQSSSPTPLHHHSSSPTHLLESSPTPLVSPVEQTDEGGKGASFRKSFSFLRRSHKDRVGDSVMTSGEGMAKRPSMLSVLLGTQYDTAHKSTFNGEIDKGEGGGGSMKLSVM